MSKLADDEAPRTAKRLHGPQLVDEEDADNEALVEAATKALDTPLVHACESALRVIASQHRLVACDPDGGECQFPVCLAMGCQGELDEHLAATPPAEPPREPRGHCNRCDRCGWPFGLLAGYCRPGDCSMRPLPPLRETCAGCGAGFVRSEPVRCVHGVNPPEMCEHCRRSTPTPESKS